MAEYLDKPVGYLELNNQAGVACKLECYWKIGRDGECKRAGSTGSITLGKTGTLNLRDLNLNDDREIWVTAYSNVSAGKDSSGDVWVRYSKNSENTSVYKITGTAFSTKTSFQTVRESENQYFDTQINVMTLKNNSGTVCKLNCFYKVGKYSEPQRVGATGSFPLGQSGTLNLQDIPDLPETASDTIWVTAYADVTAGKDCHGTAWFPYKKMSSNTEAVFSISGAINFTTITFEKINYK